ncbi:MAG: signal peptidase I [Chloroflexi bacterium]|nr:signal peptidase I [Chloroflexota bacterium]
MIEQTRSSDADATADQWSATDEGWSADRLVEQPAPSTGRVAGIGQTASWIGTVVKEVLQVVVPAILLALAIHIFLAQATVVYGQSMQPNLQPAERLVIEKVSYYFGTPQRSDIVVVDLPQMSDLLIKRVVGLPGESVEIRRGVVLIDGEVIDQSFVLLPGGTTYGPITLEADSYFVMGDNRNNSNDSRAFGPIHRDEIAGKAWMRYWPLNRFTLFD